MRRTVVVSLLLVLLGGQWTAAADDHTAITRLLERMNDALRSLDYEGTLVMLSDNRLETLHIVHRVDGARVQERMVSLNGPVRAISREPNRVTCVLADGHAISVRRHGSAHLFQSAPIDPDSIAPSYRVELLGRARTAGRDTDVIAIRPRDQLRYGLLLQLDSATGLPLKSDLIDYRGASIEQLMFTSLVLLDRGGDGAAEDGSGTVAEDRAAMRSAPIRPTRWRFERAPAGFEQTMHEVLEDAEGAEMEHFVFSDRLSAYSIYVEPGVEDGLDGVSRIGAIHAAGRRVDGHQVTAVGEVPAATVEAAVQGMRLLSLPLVASPGPGGRE